MSNTATLLRDRINHHREALAPLIQRSLAPDGKWDNRPSWDNKTGKPWDSRPSWDNKSGKK